MCIRDSYTSIPNELGLQALSYWLSRCRNLIPSRFTDAFIFESAEFILTNNNFSFDDQIYNQQTGTAMGTNFAPDYACLSMGFLEETKLFPKLSDHFPLSTCTIIKSNLLRYIDDGFIICPKSLDINLLKDVLNNLHPNINFTFDLANVITLQDGTVVKKLNFLDITIILHPSGKIDTDIYYKETNSHDYLNFFSHHPNHVKTNIPYNLAKRIIVFCSDSSTVKIRLNELREWLLKCNYPSDIIEKSYHNAMLQGPAPMPKPKDNVLPFISTYHSNLDNNRTIKLCNELLQNSRDERIQTVFKDCTTISALKQPPNLLRLLTNCKFFIFAR